AVAGCIAQQSGKDLFKRFPYIDFIFGPQNIDSLEKWIGNRGQVTSTRFRGSGVRGQKTLQTTGGQAEERIQTIDTRQQTSDYAVPAYRTGRRYTRYAEQNPIKREGRVRAWVSIMHGCDNFCSYCVVPYTRGREQSRTSRDICSEVQDIAKQGFKEITLLGQNVNSYGKNLNETNPPSPPLLAFARKQGGQGGFLNQNTDFPDLLKVIHEVSGIERIRFVTSHPRDFSDKLISAMKELPKICEHLHLPIQSGSDRVLSLMNRGYTYNEYKEKIDKLRQAIPDIAVTTDIIVGFPGETEEDFNCTITTLTEIEFDGIFAFKYSKRPDTKALSLPDHLDEDTKTRRLSKVLALQESITF
ncbi:MAG: MiaB/RimO family radical SAM methylthiotransferase, partial [Nitrospirota bacterium]